MELKIKKTHPNAIVPTHATDGSAGFDLSAALDEEVVILPGEIKSISTGIAIEIPNKSMVALMFARSSLGAKHGVSLANSVGVIDSDYRGTISMVLINHSNEPFRIKNKDRLAQLIITSVIPLTIVETDTLSDTYRDTGGFGSTGVGSIEDYTKT